LQLEQRHQALLEAPDLRLTNQPSSSLFSSCMQALGLEFRATFVVNRPASLATSCKG